MADSSRTRTFREPGGRIFGQFFSIFPPGLTLVAIAFFAGPALWPHTNPLESTGLGLVVAAAAAGTWWLSRRLGHTALVVDGRGVEIQGPWHNRRLRWDEISRFRPGTVAAVSQPRQIQVVVAELTDGSQLPVHALRVDHGRFKLNEDRARVEHPCQQVEALRPAARVAAPGPIARGSAWAAARWSPHACWRCREVRLDPQSL